MIRAQPRSLGACNSVFVRLERRYQMLVGYFDDVYGHHDDHCRVG